jgi:ATP-dependent exoDNAse (exonuclease V) alpha subunit
MKQIEAIEIIMGGHNVFLTGAAGSGKTWVLNECIEKLTESGKDVAVTATTGIAATHINGSTIHSWSRIMIRDASDLADDDVIEHIVERDKHARKNILRCDVLIIDEISMMHAYQLDAVDKICKGIKRSTRPFGGIQIILSGDFFQLPPVVKNGKRKNYAFEAQTWIKSNIKICYLEEQYRQLDKEFISVLNEIRENTVSATSKKLLDSRYNAPLANVSKPLKLYPLNQDIDVMNSNELAKINKPENTYIMDSFGDPNIVESLKRGCIAKEELSLKVGTPVLFIKNNRNEGYINGTQGIVIGFTEPDPDSEDFDEDADEYYKEYPIVKTIDGKIIEAYPESWKVTRHEKTEGFDEYGDTVIKVREVTVASVTQIPLILGWALTVHKSQGMSLDCVEMDLSRVFEEGMGYVALSRVRTLAGIRLLGMNQVALRVNQEIIKIDKIFKEESNKNKIELCSKIILDEEDKESDEHNLKIQEVSHTIFNDIYTYVAMQHSALLPSKTMEELHILYSKLMEDVNTIVYKINTNVEV